MDEKASKSPMSPETTDDPSGESSASESETGESVDNKFHLDRDPDNCTRHSHDECDDSDSDESSTTLILPGVKRTLFEEGSMDVHMGSASDDDEDRC